MDSTNPTNTERENRSKTGRFLPGHSGNAGGRPKRESVLRKQLEEGSDDAITQVLNAAAAGDMTACRLILERTVPVRKASYEAIAFELDDSSLADAAKSVLRAVAAGELSPDVGTMLITAVNGTAKIIEVDELERRLTALEGLNHEDE
ncbi:TPA: hypothetical protein ODO91_003699 [Escherichia coli]|uniref:DUF5681 domain-containing protein n=1 Tax=Enterobacteriaceae TaxID=543 RepID=UPI000B97A1AF|nr:MULTISPECIES: DUF5681 domain-containing protein [Enterobacteriaceae]EHR3332396.1 hypothetical protein [Salmonella enterica subsp. enterica serovar Senftenberg]EKD7755603.1 hypothetical protein [Shigella sonnei]EEW0591330.1 hypothetical protein [Escherichia coli]EFC1799467.1 hypothetical protein [Escherichia coli]EFH3739600.1 hypothetical protein [Escherichia coli]